MLVAALAGIGLGIYMAVEPKTRASGKLFAIWWVPGLAAASGVLMRDVVTFTVGLICFLIAGAVMVFENSRLRKSQVRGPFCTSFSAATPGIRRLAIVGSREAGRLAVPL